MAFSIQQALDYHSQGRPGKIELGLTKPCSTFRELSLAYTPGVAEPCRKIHQDPHDVFKYTTRGNLVAVVSNGSAVLGLGDIGALAAKPVMEGKGVLFKRFADVDVYDLEVNSHDPDEIIRFCQLLEPTFGGINLEDIKAPECFYIEEKLNASMGIPVFHDDQHGTAIITGAALLNGLEVAGKDIATIKVVINGAGASGIASAKHYERLGVKHENIFLCDTKGVIYQGRSEGMNPYKQQFAHITSARTLRDVVEGADVLIGLSSKGAFSGELLRLMAERPIVMALANPDPEITPEEAKVARSDVIMATGRSDYPNQVNNVLGFPFIFRGALDVRATAINEEMKLAATRALAALAKEDVPESVCRAYGSQGLRFGADYLIPALFDPRVLVWEASAVAQAAMETGVAKETVDLAEYREKLQGRLGKAREVARMLMHKAQSRPMRIVFPEGEHEKVLHAIHFLAEERIALPVLLGKPRLILEKAAGLSVRMDGVEIVDPDVAPQHDRYAEEFYSLRNRRGVTLSEAHDLMHDRNYFGSMMVRIGDADGLVAGVSQHFPDTIRPALQVIRVHEGMKRVSALYALITRKGDVFFIADCTMNIEPTPEDLAEIALASAAEVRRFDITPRVAMLSFSNFGSTEHPLCEKVRRAVALVRHADPELIVDGEMMADTAVVPEMLAEAYPFSTLRGGANVLICPDLTSANIAYKLLMRIGGCEALGPILMGMSKPVHVVQRGASVDEIVNVAAIAVVDAQESQRPHPVQVTEALVAAATGTPVAR